ncbi:MAG: TetR family transcriptional regulator [Betaproteobacteria bacterium RIFCSPLOWO2_12_FULL_68_19]|nr:MAG: TetR family transcriptional regulator [Betaproteobacteria bacterium RIFCSPLOWO2_12_FULL_68_19]
MRSPTLIKAKSEVLADRRRNSRPRRSAKSNGRIPLRERRERILAMASEFFAEYGLTAQTRALADACGISQRLLYRCFPSKGALIHEVYRRDIAGPFQATWLARLEDRSRPVAERLNEFYRDYYEAVLTRRWLRLFLYASLAEIDMAPSYIAEVITRMLEIIVAEACAERGVRPPAQRALKHELGWLLHGAVSHLAIRRHIYANSNPTPVEDVIAMHVQLFLAGLAAALPARSAARAQVVD